MFAQLLEGLQTFTPVAETPEPYTGGRILPPLDAGQEYVPEWDIERAYDQALDKSVMVDRCTYGLAEKGASVPLRVFEKKEGSPKGEIVTDHHHDVVLNHPSADPVMGSKEEMVTRTLLHHLLVGTALTGLIRGVDIMAATRGATRITGLEAEDPREVYPVPHEKYRIARWNYRTHDGQTKAWNREDLVPWRRHDPRNRLWGRSVLQSLALTVDTAVQSAQTNLLRISRDGRPGMILSDESIETPQQGRDAERMLNARQRTHRGGIMVLGASEKLVAGGMSDTDLGLLDSMAFDRDMIATAYGYLSAGFSADAQTYNNTGIFVLHEWGLVAQTMARWTSCLTSFMFTREEQRRYYIAADFSEVPALQDANMDKVKVLAGAAFKGLSTAELVKALNLPIKLGPHDNAVLVPGKLQDLATTLRGDIGEESQV